MDIVSLLISTVAGAAGGYLTSMFKKNGLGMVGNLLAGAVGGNALSLLLSAVGVLGGGEGGNNMILSIITSLLGGGLGSLVGGLFKKSSAAA